MFLGVTFFMNSIYMHIASQMLNILFSEIAYYSYVHTEINEFGWIEDTGVDFGNLDKEEREKRK